jgi:hypothetical protein
MVRGASRTRIDFRITGARSGGTRHPVVCVCDIFVRPVFGLDAQVWSKKRTKSTFFGCGAEQLTVGSMIGRRKPRLGITLGVRWGSGKTRASASVSS